MVGRPGVGFLVLGSLLLAGGCGGGGNRAGVHGKVTLDKEPVAGGSILFLPAEGTESPNAGSVITDGNYDIPKEKGPMAGTFRVEIHAPHKTGKQIPLGSPAPPGAMGDEVVESIPATYNKDSTLRKELKAGDNPIDFDLSSK